MPLRGIPQSALAVSFRTFLHVLLLFYPFRLLLSRRAKARADPLIQLLLFPFVHQMDTKCKKFFWTALTFPCSYILTILVNTIRILLSIYLPVIMERYIAPARLHTLIGIFVYFTSLCIIYHLAGLVTRRPFRKFLPPVFFYLDLVLGVSILNGTLENGKSQFLKYAVLVLSVCLTIVSFFQLCDIMRKIVMKRIKKGR